MPKHTLLLSAALAIASVAPAVAASNVCGAPGMVRAVIDSMNDFDQWKKTGFGVVDVTNAWTLAVDYNQKTVACHITAEFTNGSVVNGVFSIRKNSVGEDISRWTPDHG